ncbi:Maf family protein [Nitrobacter winogradskyi]|uniref:Septum formation protein n=2 Tax=Nitrobacter winogradskyi TaxID=913 RepID=A0ACC6AKP3_NITWI|nr:Maf family protein [Nitrobacter winogradskyi]MCP2000239.1 septum formation protein [Nitrobacter winogradskyi]GEC15653.1 Maf-like protein [Nitrobacter winogradskyi]
MAIWRESEPLILASQSRVRQLLLANAGLPFEPMPAAIDERSVQRSSGLAAADEIAVRLACEKAREVSLRSPGRYVIGADQTLECDGRLLNKPAGRTDAGAHLRALSGRTHALHAGVAIMRDGRLLFENVSVARMTMRELSEDTIRVYLDAAGDGASTSVGAYQLEGLGIHLFSRIEGDHFTILGLPLLPLLAYLRSQGLLSL